MFFLICVWINGWVNSREAGDLRRYRAHYDVIVMDIALPYFSIAAIDIKYMRIMQIMQGWNVLK